MSKSGENIGRLKSMVIKCTVMALLSIQSCMIHVDFSPAKALMGCNPRKSNRIIEKLQVGEGEIPWQVDIVVRDKPSSGKIHNCGGSLLSASYVLTAGHCINDRTISGKKYTSDPKKSFVSNHVNYEKELNARQRKFIKQIYKSLYLSDFIDYPSVF
ncbi:unnamed protein product [Lepeophtheirus salmonis]|uniref:(salmon louse) hypothetical protein n=1 Tax=Lepeophtheirus salmonis TaxID=72036 RepID=A0A7R8CNN6_LEPSM|nr:unnamed protein product [Lepeophtheirus salmonis]CAF2877094.1 unnamed protein product [Lepeophtheirus salmonis]